MHVPPDALQSPSRRNLLRGQRSARAAGRDRASGSVAVVSVLDATPVRPPADRAQPHLDGTIPFGQSKAQRSRRMRTWSLPAVLGVQAALSLRLVWSNTAFQDEALYLRAGHLEWAHWLHGVPIPDFPSYFSGAPVIYPLVGALADSIGGLAAARALSLCCMLGVTALLWATARRLYGLRAAFLATGLFATLAGTQFLGAFATFDAMALLLLAFAVWLGVRAADCQPLVSRAALLCACGLVVAAADATTYATVLFTPVVLAVVGLATWRRRQALPSVAALAIVACSWLAAVSAAIMLAGSQYLTGIRTSTLDRPPGNATVAQVLEHSYIWTSLVLILAALGALLAVRSSERGKVLPAVLAVAAILVVAAQADLHTTVSLQKHVVFGAWFAAVAAGYALARLSRVDPGIGWAPVMALPIAASTLFGSIGQADALFRVWPNSADVISVLRSAVRSHPGNFLAEDFDVEAYYLRTEVPWQRWSSTYYFSYPGARVGPAAYRAAITQHYFSLVILQFGDTAAMDRQIVADMARAGGYHVIAKTGPFTIWAAHAPQSTRGSAQ
jgi:4-amino-4-deoxy-L-arabinose transferase-like glycosyltransferase